MMWWFDDDDDIESLIRFMMVRFKSTGVHESFSAEDW